MESQDTHASFSQSAPIRSLFISQVEAINSVIDAQTNWPVSFTMLPEPPPDVEACLDSITCILGISLTAIVPAIALVIVALHVLGLEPPKIPIFTQFISEFCVVRGLVSSEFEEAANNTKPKATPPPDADIPTERSSLLPNSGTQATRPDSWRQITFTVLALLETAGWTAAVVDRARHGAGLLALVTAIVALVSWVYAALRPNIRPSRTPYYDLLTIYFISDSAQTGLPMSSVHS
ncbi:hypothetical protein AG1IA_06083 [Rhizoctonia solani AG-1 IA]|uniref:Uncharacterized protein n=1 Tax=Thanatephorus cucumeris (strain AG1-IA) TaxID=983506 RepID=L8WSW7_THACA|nr:hypothetical protein AG1IA_06083 [Rhizoctonia solani AG-1 IA]